MMVPIKDGPKTSSMSFGLTRHNDRSSHELGCLEKIYAAATSKPFVLQGPQ